MITASGYTDDLVKDRNFVFTLMPPHHLSIKPFSDYIGKLSPKRVALIVSQNAYYETIARGLKDNLARDDIEIWKESSLPPEEKDFRSLISHLKIKEVDLVIAFLLEGGPLASFLRQSKEQKLDAQILSGPGPAYDDVILKDLQLAEGLIHFDYYDPSTKEFRAKYKKRFGVDSKIGSGRSYDSVYLAKEAIERCGLEPIPLQRCILNSSYKGVTGPISFDKDGGIVGSTEIVKLYKGINGRFIEVN